MEKISLRPKLLEFNQDDPARVTHFLVFADGDDLSAVGFLNSDNLDISSNSLMVQNDRSNARIWRYDHDTRVWKVVATVNDRREESSGIVGASKWFGDGTWLLDVRARGRYESRRLKGALLLKREAGQLLLMNIPEP